MTPHSREHQVDLISSEGLLIRKPRWPELSLTNESGNRLGRLRFREIVRKLAM